MFFFSDSCVSSTKKVVCFLTLLFSIGTGYPQSFDSLYVKNDTLNNRDTTIFDSTITADTSKISKDASVKSKNIPLDSTKAKLATTTPDSGINSENDSIIDLNGSYFGIRVGWTIGSFELVNSWQHSLPESLSFYNLKDTSYIKKDPTKDSIHYTDSTLLRYVVKELPGEFNISIPVSLLFAKIGDKNKKTLLLTFAYVGKNQKSVITGLVDSLSETVNIKHNLNTFLISLEGNYSLPFPERYFQVDGVDKCYFTLGAAISSVIVKINNNVDFGGESVRMDKIRTIVEDSLDSKSAIGASLTLKGGIFTIRALSKKSIVEFGITYALSRFDYFYESDKRLHKEWIDPHVKDHNKPLAFFTNKIELSVGLLTRTKPMNRH